MSNFKMLAANEEGGNRALDETADKKYHQLLSTKIGSRFVSMQGALPRRGQSLRRRSPRAERG